MKRNHINVLELKAILLALEPYFRYNCNVKHVHILTDNSTALAYINNMGGMYSVLSNTIAKHMWEFAQKKGFWISSSHIPDERTQWQTMKNEILKKQTKSTKV